MTNERKEVRVKLNRYQPTKAEVEEVFESPRKADRKVSAYHRSV